MFSYEDEWSISHYGNRFTLVRLSRAALPLGALCLRAPLPLGQSEKVFHAGMEVITHR